MCCIMRNIEKCGDYTVRLGKADGKKYYYSWYVNADTFAIVIYYVLGFGRLILTPPCTIIVWMIEL